jgi:TonB-dependent SusC/RagA subfamily outer membrane receptor
MKLNKILFLIFSICLSLIAYGQKPEKKSDKPFTVSGKVFSIDKEPVEGAVFYIDNVKTSYRTDSRGSYKLKVSASALNLEARSAQYGVSKTPINGQSKINFTLNGIPDNETFVPGDSVKVQNPYDGKKRARKMNTYSNIWQMIRGEVSGVVVSGRSVQIQQGKSFFGSSTPLFVINGVIVQSIDNVNPVEVKSIEVLKGSQAAIYGVRGANGVISITLLNGSEKEK